MTITHAKILQLNRVLRDLSTSIEKKYVKLHYALGRNLAYLEPILKVVGDLQSPDPEYSKYEDERRKLLNKFARKDEKKRPIKKEIPLPSGAVNQEFDIEDQDAFDAALKELDEKEEFAKIVEDEKDRVKQFNELMKAEVELDKVYVIKMSKCKPQNAFDGIQMHLLLECGILEWDIADDDDSWAEIPEITKVAS